MLTAVLTAPNLNLVDRTGHMRYEQCAENEERLALHFFVDRTGHMRCEQCAET